MPFESTSTLLMPPIDFVDTVSLLEAPCVAAEVLSEELLLLPPHAATPRASRAALASASAALRPSFIGCPSLRRAPDAETISSRSHRRHHRSCCSRHRQRFRRSWRSHRSARILRRWPRENSSCSSCRCRRRGGAPRRAPRRRYRRGSNVVCGSQGLLYRGGLCLGPSSE